MSVRVNGGTAGETTPADRRSALRRGTFEPRRLVPRRRTGMWITGAVALVVVGAIVATVVSRPAMSWPIVGEYLFSAEILTGLLTTVYLTVLAMVIGLAVGLLMAIMMRSRNPVLNGLATLYVWLFRAIPGLVQLLFWYNLASLFPTLDIGIPFGPVFWSLNPNEFMTPLVAACLGLGLSEGAYMAEIIRGGLIAVPQGQHEAASALGLSSSQTLRKVVLPQAMRSIVPPIGNSFIGMLKYTSLASVISVMELLHSAQRIYSANFQIIPLLVVASLWYLVLTTLLTLVQRRIENHFNRGFDGRSITPPRGSLLGRRLRPRPAAASVPGSAT